MRKCPKCYAQSDMDFCRQCGILTEAAPQNPVKEPAAARATPDEAAQPNRTTEIGSRDLSFQAPASRVVPIPEADAPPETPGARGHWAEPQGGRARRRARDLSPLFMVAVVSQALAIVVLAFLMAYMLRVQPAQPAQASSSATPQPPKPAEENKAPVADANPPGGTVANHGVSLVEAQRQAPPDDGNVDLRIADKGLEREQTEKVLAHLKNKVSDARAAIARAERRLRELKAQEAQEEDKLKALREERAQAQTELRQLSAQGRKKKQEVARAEERLARVNGEIDKANRKVKGLRDEISWVKGGNGVRRPQTRRAGRT